MTAVAEQAPRPCADVVEHTDGLVVERFPVGRQQANAYLAYHTGSYRGILVDPGADADILLARIAALHVDLGTIVLTHAHWDHVGAAQMVGEATGAPVYLHEADAELLRRAPLFAARVDGVPMRVPREVTWFAGEMSLTLEPLRLTLIPTPGHTAGACVVRLGQALFTGDTLLQRKAGRTDLPGGDARTLAHSLRRIGDELHSVATVFPGHGAPWAASEAETWLTETGALTTEAQ